MTKARTPVTALVLLLLAIASPTRADAQGDGDKAKAQRLLSQGNDLLAGGDNDAALAAFEAAYAAYPSPSLLLNIGTTLRALGRKAEAANTYARWIQARQNPERLAEVEEVLTELDRAVAGITVKTATGAAVQIDGKAVPAEALDAVIRVEPGNHIVIARKSGFFDAREEISLAAGSRETVTLELAARLSTGATPDEPADESRLPPASEPGVDSGGSAPMRIVGLSIAGLGVASIAAGVFFGLEARSLSNELDDEGERLAASGEPWTAELLAKEGDGKSAQTKMIVFSAIGAAAVAGGGVLYLLGRRSGTEPTGDVAISPTVSGDGIGWAISGAF